MRICVLCEYPSTCILNRIINVLDVYIYKYTGSCLLSFAFTKYNIYCAIYIDIYIKA